MRLILNAVPVATALCCLLVAQQSASQVSPYVYVKMSLGVPWFLYFVFLACILLPFFVMILVAWRRYYKHSKDGSRRSTDLEEY